jgi:hypothetical protein
MLMPQHTAMTQRRYRFVLLSQQALAFAFVLAVTLPAAAVGTLDIVGPATSGATPHPAGDQGAGSEPAGPEQVDPARWTAHR